VPSEQCVTHLAQVGLFLLLARVTAAFADPGAKDGRIAAGPADDRRTAGQANEEQAA